MCVRRGERYPSVTTVAVDQRHPSPHPAHPVGEAVIVPPGSSTATTMAPIPALRVSHSSCIYCGTDISTGEK